MLLTRLCLVRYATPRMLKLLLFCLWPSRIVVPFDRSILIVLKIGLFVNCVSAKPAQTQIGYLVAMVNGDVNHRIPQWAFV